MGIRIVEHQTKSLDDFILVEDEDVQQFYQRKLMSPRKFPKTNEDCFHIHLHDNSISLKANYYIGLDWLVAGERYIQVLPKMNNSVVSLFESKAEIDEPEAISPDKDEQPEFDNSNFSELDYIKMLMNAMKHPAISNHTEGLVFIDWESNQIEIEQKDDALTPFLIVQFLNLLKKIVRKGLKKSYYKSRENLTNRVKGKVLVGVNIKHNVLKNRFTQTYCEYQEFGYNGTENRFLKKVLHFIEHYIAQNQVLLKGNLAAINQLVGYCKPVFETVSSQIGEHELKNIKHNPFFREYEEAIKIGNCILKRFAYNITNASQSKIKTPPFWIDMPRLFELYVYYHLLTVYKPSDVKYHFKTYGNELDFIVNSEKQKMVIDAKYKLHYKASHIHDDIRQVSGYARLGKVYGELGKEDSNELIDCLIIYPDNSALGKDYQLSLALEGKEIKAYKRVYKIGIPVPKM